MALSEEGRSDNIENINHAEIKVNPCIMELIHDTENKNNIQNYGSQETKATETKVETVVTGIPETDTSI